MNIPTSTAHIGSCRDVEKQFLRKRKTLPSFVNIAICNDHGAPPSRRRAIHTWHRGMADNDLALDASWSSSPTHPIGRIWRIFVTQDDAGGEPDT